MSISIAVSTIQCLKKIPPGDSIWNKFNASFQNRELTTKEIMDSVYEGYPVTTQLKTPWRTSENYLKGQHLALDFDSENEQSTVDYLAKDKFISKYATFIHTTISHRDDAPRSRVFFLLEEPIMQSKNYVLAATALLWLFGTADKSCKDAVRFWFGAPNCEMEFLGNFLDLATIKKIITNYQESGHVEKRSASKINYTAPPSQMEVADALKHIPAWSISYDEWVEVLMGIHSSFGDAGLDLADSWADGKKNEVANKWKSFDGSGTITIATVFGIAKKFGWKKQSEI